MVPILGWADTQYMYLGFGCHSHMSVIVVEVLPACETVLPWIVHILLPLQSQVPTFDNLTAMALPPINDANFKIQDYYTFHPLYNIHVKKADRPSKVWANKGEDKAKVFCTPCLNYAIGEIVIAEESAHQAGRIARIRTHNEIKRYC